MASTAEQHLGAHLLCRGNAETPLYPLFFCPAAGLQKVV